MSDSEFSSPALTLISKESVATLETIRHTAVTNPASRGFHTTPHNCRTGKTRQWSILSKCRNPLQSSLLSRRFPFDSVYHRQPRSYLSSPVLSHEKGKWLFESPRNAVFGRCPWTRY